MFYYDRFPFWCAYFQKLGFDVVLSSPTDRQDFRARRRAGHRAALFPGQGCARARAGTARKNVDYVLAPNIVNCDVPADWENVYPESHLCPWNQTLPFVLRAVPQLEPSATGF